MVGPVRLGIGVAFVLAVSASGFAYEKDVRFSLTFSVCTAAGFDFADSLEIASADERVDENDSTTATVKVEVDSKSQEAQRRRDWHALDDSRQKVLDRLQVLWDRAFVSKSLVDFGQYLHFLQDHFSHRETKGEDWKPFGWQIGHAVKAHQSDRVPSDRKLAEQMVAATLDSVSRFMDESLEKEPRKFDTEVPAIFVAALADSYSKDSLGFWNEADAFKTPIKLERALFEIGLGEVHVPHVSRIIKMRFNQLGQRIDQW